jgi:hypothetical protein
VLLRRARDRADARIAALQELRERIDQALASDDLAGDALRETEPPPEMWRLTLPPGASRGVGTEVIPVPELKATTHEAARQPGDASRRQANTNAAAMMIGSRGGKMIAERT